ncbi:MAG: hypothetical protein BGO14_01705 [Chlamydiales bacterium 38-26]|nr:pyridoxal phosphate-dependent aminotransferase family protein [Chlamydiales bacterium]OJV08163.1 MAG: hypothetical protein BGO14_01705 [Chlamydiales bacterium 38-26]
MKSFEDLRLERRKRFLNYRELLLKNSPIDFASNDYLGLARSTKLKEAFEIAWHQYEDIRLGSSGSRLLTGNSREVLHLEEQIAHFHGYAAGTLFNCGYMANIGVLSAVATEKDAIFYDTHVHASMHDGMRLSAASRIPFRHQNMQDLESKLEHIACRGKRFICIESLYSTDGTVTSLKEIARLAQKYQAYLIIDEAHAVGVWGSEGRGLVDSHEISSKVFALILTFGKALGVSGAIVLGSTALKEILTNFAKSFIYSTALPRYAITAIQSSYAIFPYLEEERQSLYERIKHYQELLNSKNTSQIQIFKIKGNRPCSQAARALDAQGFDVRALLSPTVRLGQECLRVTLHSYNTAEQVNELYNCLMRIKSDE